MANFDSVNYAKINASPSSKIASGQVKGDLWVAYDEYTARANLTTADTLRTGIKIPAGAKVHFLSYKNFTNGGTLGIGVAGALTKYGAALAASVAGAIVPVMLDNATGVEEDILVTPSVSGSATGLYQFAMYFSKV